MIDDDNIDSDDIARRTDLNIRLLLHYVLLVLDRRFDEQLLKMGGKVIKTTDGGYITLIGEIRTPEQP